MSKQQRSKRLTAVEQVLVETVGVKAVREAVDQQGGAKAVVVRRVGKGVVTRKLWAKPVLSADQALGKVIAEKIVAHMEGGERGIYAEMMQLSVASRPCQASALGEIHIQRNKRIEETQQQDALAPEFAARKVNSIRASFSRVIVVIEAMTSDVHAFDFAPCESFADMVAVAREHSAGRGKHTKTMTASGFKTWLEKAERIVDLKGYDKDTDTSIAQVARLEQFIVKAVAVYAKVSEKVTGLRFDVAALQSIVAPKVVAKRTHIRKAA
ncbi:MAG: hypothetical protein NUV80_06495 [Candidatus Berkelbacteria bacterium]|nr:hypothetical protein [Candidatus Berkelbacteria bacterium]